MLADCKLPYALYAHALLLLHPLQARRADEKAAKKSAKRRKGEVAAVDGITGSCSTNGSSSECRKKRAKKNSKGTGSAKLGDCGGATKHEARGGGGGGGGSAHKAAAAKSEVYASIFHSRDRDESEGERKKRLMMVSGNGFI